MQKNILIIASEFPPATGGIGNHAYQLALHLQSKYAVTVVADISLNDKEIIKKFKQTVPFQLHLIERSNKIWKTYLKRINIAFTAAKNADIIIGSGKFSLWLILLLRFRFSSLKYIAVVHGSELDLKNRLAKKMVNNALQKCNHIISVSHFTKQYIAASIQQKIACTIIPNGINNQEFETIEKKNVYTAPLQLITIGSVTERKGQENIIRALPLIIQKFPNTIYHLVGKPVLQKALFELAFSLHVEKSVIFHGAVNRDQLLSLLAQSHIKLMLSNHTSEGDFEGFGIAVLEANAAGKPAIGSLNSGIADAIQDNYNGLLINQKDTTALLNAIATIINDYSAFAKQSLVWANQHDWKKIVDQYILVIESLY